MVQVGHEELHKNMLKINFDTFLILEKSRYMRPNCVMQCGLVLFTFYYICKEKWIGIITTIKTKINAVVHFMRRFALNC